MTLFWLPLSSKSHRNRCGSSLLLLLLLLWFPLLLLLRIEGVMRVNANTILDSQQQSSQHPLQQQQQQVERYEPHLLLPQLQQADIKEEDDNTQEQYIIKEEEESTEEYEYDIIKEDEQLIIIDDVMKRRDLQQDSDRVAIQTPFRINCGNLKNPNIEPTYIDTSNGEMWHKDCFFAENDGVPTMTSSVCEKTYLSYPQSSRLYQTYCYSRNSPKRITYNIPITTSRQYYIRLYFFEARKKNIGDRLFDVAIDGVIMSENLDLVASFGYGKPASFRYGPIYGNANGRLVIQIFSKKFAATISGIEITSLQDNPTTLSPTSSPQMPPQSRPTRTPRSARPTRSPPTTPEPSRLFINAPITIIHTPQAPTVASVPVIISRPSVPVIISQPQAQPQASVPVIISRPQQQPEASVPVIISRPQQPQPQAQSPIVQVLRPSSSPLGDDGGGIVIIPPTSSSGGGGGGGIVITTPTSSSSGGGGGGLPTPSSSGGGAPPTPTSSSSGGGAPPTPTSSSSGGGGLPTPTSSSSGGGGLPTPTSSSSGGGGLPTPTSSSSGGGGLPTPTSSSSGGGGIPTSSSSGGGGVPTPTSSTSSGGGGNVPTPTSSSSSGGGGNVPTSPSSGGGGIPTSSGGGGGGGGGGGDGTVPTPTTSAGGGGITVPTTTSGGIPTTPTSNGAVVPTSDIKTPTTTTAGPTFMLRDGIRTPSGMLTPTSPSDSFMPPGMAIPTGMMTPSGIIIPTFPLTPTGIQTPSGILTPTGTILTPSGAFIPTGVLTPLGIQTPSGIITPSGGLIQSSPTNNNTTINATSPIRMKCGTTLSTSWITFVTDTFRNMWFAERYLIDQYNTTYIDSVPSTTQIRNSFDDELYQSIRTGPSFGYEIPVPMGEYDITLHFAEIYYTASKQRIFTVQVEDEIISNVDIYNLAGGFAKYTMEFQKSIDDGNISIQLLPPTPDWNASITNGLPMICAIEIKLVGPHFAHAVSNGPYTVIDRNNVGYATVNVDGSNSHTHGPGMTITNIVWSEGNKILGRGKLKTSFNISVGDHEVTLMVQDSGGSVSYDQTTITVHPNTYPSITSIAPTNGSLSGQQEVTLIGSSFTSSNNVTVMFGDIILSNTSITFMNNTMIKVITPSSLMATDVNIRVMNLNGTSTEPITYTYIEPAIPIIFQAYEVFKLSKVVTCAFGPDQYLYVGTTDGKLGRYLVDFLNIKKPTVKTSFLQQVISTERAILGIAFDPMDTNYVYPKVYFSNSDLFHGDRVSSSGLAINGKISCVTTTPSSFTNLIDIITGLPVSDHDHGVNSIVFGNNGELYIAIGSNTNGGRPGKLSSTGVLKESYLSAAIIKANLSDPNFNGNITYTAPDDGDMMATGIEVYANGVRNPFGLIMHSNGNLYATDNGPNAGYGNMLSGCGPNEFIPDRTDIDKLLLIRQGAYYGHPNPKRAVFQRDARQCVWRATNSAADNGLTTPMAILPSAMEGITEYNANYFGGQMRGNLIIAKYGDELYRFALTPDGTNVLVEAKTGIKIPGTDYGLAVTVSPDGSIVEGRYTRGSVAVRRPVEPATADMKLYSVFPTRGPSTGGNVITIYGLNFKAPISVTAAGLNCSDVKVISTRQIECKLPGGTPGLVDIVVQQGSSSEMKQAYRYITGMP